MPAAAECSRGLDAVEDFRCSFGERHPRLLLNGEEIVLSADTGNVL
jgi:hypothetical protein